MSTPSPGGELAHRTMRETTRLHPAGLIPLCETTRHLTIGGYRTPPILLLSQHIETRHADELVGTGAFGYLLKDRVLRVDEFVDAVQRVAAGGSALDASVIGALVAPRRRDDQLASLSTREFEVLELVAQGRTNASIARSLVVAE